MLIKHHQVNIKNHARVYYIYLYTTLRDGVVIVQKFETAFESYGIYCLDKKISRSSHDDLLIFCPPEGGVTLFTSLDAHHKRADYKREPAYTGREGCYRWKISYRNPHHARYGTYAHCVCHYKNCANGTTLVIPLGAVTPDGDAADDAEKTSDCKQGC